MGMAIVICLNLNMPAKPTRAGKRYLTQKLSMRRMWLVSISPEAAHCYLSLESLIAAFLKNYPAEPVFVKFGWAGIATLY
jgi:hypothetical protein